MFVRAAYRRVHMGISLEEFKKRLNNGDYEKIGNARRALGKAQEIQGEERDKANRLIDRHFADGSEAAAPAPKAKAKSLPEGHKGVLKPEPKKRGRKPKAEVAADKSETAESSSKQLELFSLPTLEQVPTEDRARVEKLLFLERMVNAAVSGFQAVSNLPSAYSDVVGSSVNSCNVLLTECTTKLRVIVESL